MAPDSEKHDFGLPAVLRVLRRRWTLIALCFVVLVGAALPYSLSQTPLYTASSSLLFRDPAFDFKLFGTGFFSPSVDPERAAATNQRLVNLQAVAQRTARRLGDGLTAVQVGDSVRSEQSGNSDVVDISATAPDPELAARMANVFAEEFIAFRRDADRLKIREARELIESEIARLTDAERDGPEARSLDDRVRQLEIIESLQTGNAELVQRAQAPGSPSSPNTLRDVILAAVIALTLGLILAFLFEHLDRRVRDPDELADRYDLPLLAVVPQSNDYRVASAADAAAGGRLEIFHMLRARLRYFNVDRRVSTLLVTSSAPGEGKSTVSWHLALANATSGRRTLLLEADLRRPSIARTHALAPGPGVADLVIGQATLDEAIQRIELPASAIAEDHHPTLDIMVAGPLAPNPASLLESRRFEELLGRLSEIYDVVIIDTPPVGIVADALPLLSLVSGVIVVGRVGQTRQDAVARLRDQMTAVSAPALGVVANGASARGGGYYEYYGYREAPRLEEPQPVA